MAWPPPAPPPDLAAFTPPFDRRYTAEHGKVAEELERKQARAALEAEIAAEEKAAEFGRANNIPHVLWEKQSRERIAQLRAELEAQR